MLIDESYFVGPLEIAQLGQKAVVDKLKDFINRWEPVIMQAALGYDFYQLFLEGLNVGSDESPDQRWLDLLNGVVFTNQYRIKKRWVGFAGGQNTQTVIASQRDDLFIYAGITPGFPVGSFSYNNPDLKGWNYTVEIFGIGTIQPVTEWNYKTGGGIVLTDTGYTTTPGERWVIHFTGKKVQNIQSGGQNLLSPLAGFIYYEYMKDLATQNTGIGVVKPEGENSQSAGPGQKMTDAYNDACRQMGILYELLWADRSREVKVYPEFDYRQADVSGYGVWYMGWYNPWISTVNDSYSFRPVNVFGI